MIDKFKTFLAGKPYNLDESWQETWAYKVAVILPSVLRKWYDPEFKGIEKCGSEYFAAARKKLLALSAFKKGCAEASDIVQGLKLWIDFLIEEKRKELLGKKTKKPTTVWGHTALPEVLEEGAIVEMHIAKHERNPELRKKCIAYYAAKNGGCIKCEACGMSFAEKYGGIGAGYIEVHHLNPISQTEDVHTVNPETDLVPLCANCHAMIHRLMAAEKKESGLDCEGVDALNNLKALIGEHA